MKEWFNAWFVQLIKDLLINEGNPVLRILASLIGSFLIFACYILLSELTRRLKNKYPAAVNSLEAKIFENIIAWSTIILIAILLLTGIVAALKALFQEIWPPDNEVGASQMTLKQAVEMNLNAIKHVARFVFYSLLLIVALTVVENLSTLLHAAFQSFYHVRKTQPRQMNPRLLFVIESQFQSHLDEGNGISADLWQRFQNQGISLSQNAIISAQKQGDTWLIIDRENKQTYFVKREENQLNVYSTA